MAVYYGSYYTDLKCVIFKGIQWHWSLSNYILKSITWDKSNWSSFWVWSQIFESKFISDNVSEIFILIMFRKETYFLLYWISLQTSMTLKVTLVTSLLFGCQLVMGISWSKLCIWILKNTEAKLVRFHRFKKLFELFIFLKI